MPMLKPGTRLDWGQLAANGMLVKMLQAALGQSELNLNSVPDLIVNIDDRNAWRNFVFPDHPDQVHTHNEAEFRLFIEGPRPKGCQTPLGLLERMLRGTDAWGTYLKLSRKESPGPPEGNRNAAGPRLGNLDLDGCNSIRDIVPDCTAPNDDHLAIIPIAAETPPPRKRDYARESKQGNSVGYKVGRLRRGAERDPSIRELYEKVVAGELSAHAASVLAGFIPRAITIPAVPEPAGRRLARHFSREEFSRLVDAALDAYGVTRPENGA